MSPSTGASPITGRVVSAAILAVVAIAFLAVGITFWIVPAGSLPTWLGHELIKVNGHYRPSPGHHPLRMVGSLIAGVVFAIGAWFALRYRAATAGAVAEPDRGTGSAVTPAR